MSRVGASVDRLEAQPLDGGGVAVTGRLPGPAGLATVGLLGGAAELAVDVVEHDALVSLRLDDPSGPDSVRLARMLLGPVAASRLTGAPGAAGTIWDRETDDTDLDRWGAGRDRRTEQGLGPVGRLALALGELSAAHLDDRAVAVGLVEAGVLALALPPELDVVPSGPDLVRAGVARWQALGDQAFADDDPDLLQRLVQLEAGWTTAVAPIDAELADQLGALLRDLVRHLGDPPVAAAGGAGRRLRSFTPEPVHDVSALPSLAAAMPAAAPAQALDRATTAAEGAAAERDPAPALEVAFGADLDARLIGVEHDGHHVRVHVGGLDEDDAGAPEPWLRVFVAGDRPTPVALAPFPESGRPWRTAVALVPPGLASAQLLVDVTTSPAEAWASPADRLLARAAHLGALAARAGRRGDGSAPDAWDTSAEAWDEVGDEARADAARDLAELRDPVGLGPLLVDELA